MAEKERAVDLRARAEGPSFAELLRRYRAELTQEELAERAGLSVRAVSDLERGARRAPYRETVRLLAEALGLGAQERAALERAARRGYQLREPRPVAVARAAATPIVPAAQHTRARRDVRPLVGRAREMALIERHLVGEGPPVLLLVGEPGIGKSRLQVEARERAQGLGWSVLSGGCQRRGGQHPFAPVAEALESYMAQRSEVELRADLQGCAWLVRLLPELMDGPIASLPDWIVPPEHERRLIERAVERYLHNVAGPAGTLLLLDDLHWAGADALELLAVLAHASPESSLRIIATYRDTEIQPQDTLATILADLAHAGLAHQHTLASLTPDEAGALLDQLLDGVHRVPKDAATSRERVVQRAGGVPFYLVSYAQGLRAHTGEGPMVDAVPWDVAQGVRQRLAALPAPTREMLGVAAVIGQVVSRRLLAAVAHYPDDIILAALEAAAHVRLVEEAGPEAYAFAHELVREVIEGELSAGRRALLHRRVAEAIEAGAAELVVETVAYHYSQSDAVEQAALWLERAGDQALAQRATAAAHSYYSAAIERLERVGQPGAAVREKAGAVLTMIGHFDAALQTLEQAAATYEAAGDLESLGRVVATIGMTHRGLGTSRQAVERLRDVLARCEKAAAPPRTLGSLYLSLGWFCTNLGWFGESQTAYARAIDHARQAGDETVQAAAQAAYSIGLIATGEGAVESALQSLEDAAQRIEAGGDLSHASVAYMNLAWICLWRGEFEASARHNSRAAAAAEQVGDGRIFVNIMHTDGVRAFVQGQWAQARMIQDRAVALYAQIDASGYTAWPLLALAEVGLAEGDAGAIERYLDSGAELAARHGLLLAIRYAHRLLAQRDVQAGRPASAVERLTSLLDRPGLLETDVMELLPILAWAYLRMDNVTRCGEVVEHMLDRARRTNRRVTLVDALWAQLRLETRREQWTQAGAALEEGLALARRLPYPYEEALLLQAGGALHTRRGERAQARTRLRAALEVFERLGARPRAEQVRQDLARLG